MKRCLVLILALLLIGSTANYVSAATLYNIRDLGTLGGSSSFGLDVNSHRQVTGNAQEAASEPSPRLNTFLVGELIGTASTTGITRAFIWQNGAINELIPYDLYAPTNTGPTTNYHSVAMDINNAGLVVGNSQRIAGSPAVATLWQNGQPIDLNSLIPAGSGWILTSAEGINSAGDIVGFGTINGATHAYLLTPVPEPASVAVLCIAVLLTSGRRRRA